MHFVSVSWFDFSFSPIMVSQLVLGLTTGPPVALTMIFLFFAAFIMRKELKIPPSQYLKYQSHHGYIDLH